MADSCLPGIDISRNGGPLDRQYQEDDAEQLAVSSQGGKGSLITPRLSASSRPFGALSLMAVLLSTGGILKL